MDWPFKRMQVGETRVIYDVVPGRAQITAHSYGRVTGKRFKTATVREPDGRVGIVVKRLKDDVAAARHSKAVCVYGYEHLEVGETAEFHGHAAVARVLNSIQRMEVKLGRKFKRKSVSMEQQYLILRLTRVA